VVEKDQLTRIGLRTPQSGMVQQLAIHTVDGAIGNGETIILIVPESDQLVVGARCRPRTSTSCEWRHPFAFVLNKLCNDLARRFSGDVVAQIALLLHSPAMIAGSFRSDLRLLAGQSLCGPASA